MNIIKRKREIYLLMGTLCVFFFAMVLCLILPTYDTYTLSYLPFGLVLISLFFLYFLLKAKMKDHKAKGYKIKFLSKLSIQNATKENRFKFYFQVLSIILFIIFFIRFYFYKNYVQYTYDGISHYYKYYDYLHLSGQLIGSKLEVLVTLNHFERIIASIFNDLWIGLIILSLVSSIYLKEKGIQVRRYIGSPVALLLTIFSPIVIKGLINGNFSYRCILMGVELGIIDFYYFSSFLEDTPYKLNKNQVKSLLSFSVPFLISSMSCYTPSNIFGFTLFSLGTPSNLTTFSHRFLIYFSFILPIMYYVLLTPLSKEERKGALIQISLGTLFGYICVNRFDIWSDLSTWPLHLCNTAMYTMPLTLLFKSYGLFYFTFFINVLGAFLALLMPNYSSSATFLSPVIFEFFINHWHAFFMPILIVLLDIYERPKIKYFIYSQIGFLIYFVLVMFINTYLTAHGTSCDFFFINSNFVADKLGQWAKDIFNSKLTFQVGDYTYVIHLLYDIIYYLVYVILGLGMWFIYELIFRGIDEHELLIYAKKNQISKHQAYLLKQEKGDLPMDKNKITLNISHMAKKYHNAEKYTIKDFSLSLEGGKIYGFLGKNGAGKSTIIKSIVGIHGFEEGYIEACGYDVSENPLEAKKIIGYVPDNYALYENLTGRQYINYIADLYSVSKKNRITREEELVNRFEMSFQYDKPMKTYSHGMKQKITIIAALIHEPKIWILDEPMTGLDPNSIYQIKECMKVHAKKGNIVFFSSHIIDVVKNLCDEVIIIKHGDLIKKIDLNTNPSEREVLEQTFLLLTSDNEKESEVLLKEQEKGIII